MEVILGMSALFFVVGGVYMSYQACIHDDMTPAAVSTVFWLGAAYCVMMLSLLI